MVQCVGVCQTPSLGVLTKFLTVGGQRFTGTVSNEATSEMGFPAWPAGCTCVNF